MPNYTTNLWTGTDGLKLTGVFPNLGSITDTIEFDSNDMLNGGLHSVENAAEARDDSRKFLWGVLEQFYTAYTGGANKSVDRDAGNTPTLVATGSGEGKTTKMTVTKSSLSLIDEDTAKTTYTVVFNYAVGSPGGNTLEVEAE